MKQEELFKKLITQLIGMETMHEEYQENDTQYIVDSLKEGDTLTIKVTLKENKDKKDFEKWLQNVDEDLFGEVLEALNEDGLFDIEQIYNSPDYKSVINKVKNKTKELAVRKIQDLQKLIGQ